MILYDPPYIGYLPTQWKPLLKLYLNVYLREFPLIIFFEELHFWYFEIISNFERIFKNLTRAPPTIEHLMSHRRMLAASTRGSQLHPSCDYSLKAFMAGFPAVLAGGGRGGAGEAVVSATADVRRSPQTVYLLLSALGTN